MPTVICNAPSCLIPKELFKEEKTQEYWNILYNMPLHHEDIGKDDLENFILLYPSPKEVNSIHEISFMYNSLQEKFSGQSHAICINVHDNGLSLLTLKDRHIVYTGYFRFSANEDVLYHLANVTQHFFENISQVTFFYQKLPPTVLRLLNNYYEMKEL